MVFSSLKNHNRNLCLSRLQTDSVITYLALVVILAIESSSIKVKIGFQLFMLDYSWESRDSYSRGLIAFERQEFMGIRLLRLSFGLMGVLWWKCWCSILQSQWFLFWSLSDFEPRSAQYSCPYCHTSRTVSPFPSASAPSSVLASLPVSRSHRPQS